MTYNNNDHCKRSDNRKCITMIARKARSKKTSWEWQPLQKGEKRKLTKPLQPPLPLPKIPTSWKIKTFILTKVRSKIMKTMTIAKRTITRTPWIIAKKQLTHKEKEFHVLELSSKKAMNAIIIVNIRTWSFFKKKAKWRWWILKMKHEIRQRNCWKNKIPLP